MTTDQFSELALSFPNTIASPHFDRTAFKVVGEKIFATLHEPAKTANLRFSPADQSVFTLIDKKAIYAVNNKWGLQGWTTFELEQLNIETVLDAIDTAYKEAMKTKKR